MYSLHETVRSIISPVDNVTAHEEFATLLCDINGEKKIQCLLDMQAQMPAQQGCETADDSGQYDFCGSLPHFCIFI